MRAISSSSEMSLTLTLILRVIEIPGNPSAGEVTTSFTGPREGWGDVYLARVISLKGRKQVQINVSRHWKQMRFTFIVLTREPARPQQSEGVTAPKPSPPNLISLTLFHSGKRGWRVVSFIALSLNYCLQHDFTASKERQSPPPTASSGFSTYIIMYFSYKMFCFMSCWSKLENLLLIPCAQLSRHVRSSLNVKHLVKL